MEFTRPENNVLNLYDVRYDFLVTTTVEIADLAPLRSSLRIYDIKFPEKYEINNSVSYFALNFVEKFCSNCKNNLNYLNNYIRQIETSYILSSLARLSLEK